MSKFNVGDRVRVVAVAAEYEDDASPVGVGTIGRVVETHASERGSDEGEFDVSIVLEGNGLFEETWGMKDCELELIR